MNLLNREPLVPASANTSPAWLTWTWGKMSWGPRRPRPQKTVHTHRLHLAKHVTRAQRKVRNKPLSSVSDGETASESFVFLTFMRTSAHWNVNLHLNSQPGGSSCVDNLKAADSITTATVCVHQQSIKCPRARSSAFTTSLCELSVRLQWESSGRSVSI